tara:strand:- start:2642 stop:3316 length:675 start_codon:yes stop_codon:yes gene_type:complete
MKKIIFTSLLSMAFLASFAQIKPKQEDWFFYDYTYDFMTLAPAGVSQEFIPNGHTISLLKEKVFGNGKFAIAGGIDYSSQAFYSNLYVSTDLSDGEEIYQILDTDSIERNRLYTEFIDAIFELRYRTLPNDDGKFFRWYVGLKGGVRVQSTSRLRTNNAIVSFENLGMLNRYRYGVYTRMGYGWFNLYAYYGLAELFTDGALINAGNASVTGIQPVSIGISLIF